LRSSRLFRTSKTFKVQDGLHLSRDASLLPFLKGGVLTTPYAAPVSSALVETEIQSEAGTSSGNDHSFSYLLGFAAVGLFFSVMSYALTPTELLPEGAAALAPEMQTLAGLNLSEIEIPAGLKLAEYPAH
jgi:hypothetical protein